MRNGMYIEHGNVAHYKNDKFHRENGPAIIYSNGNESWWLDGERHRIDGPAIIQIYSGHREWWINGKQVFCKTQEEFEKLMKLKVFW